MKNISKLTYRPDIDGLRAVAILSVLIFHAFPAYLPGGFVGVDIFFVISGYLISCIIFKGLHTGNFSFLTFYSNRVKRIFPSLITVLVLVYAFSWIVLLPDELRLLGKHMATSLAFVQNFTLLKKGGYFDIASDLKPLMHLWSLSIEEQFYFIYPIGIFLAWRHGLNIFTFVLIATSVSFVLNILIVYPSPNKAFFLPITRFWELLLGCLLGYIHTFKADSINKTIYKLVCNKVFFSKIPSFKSSGNFFNTCFATFGIILIIFAVFKISKDSIFPGWNALLPVVGALFTIMAGPNNFISQKFLSNRPIIFIGLISYPLYLWHWPILSISLIINGSPLTEQTKLWLLIISFVLSVLTYFLIEKPIRFGKKSNKKIMLLIGAAIFMLFLGFYTYLSNGFYSRLDDEKARIAPAINEWEYPRNLEYKKENGIDYFFKKTKKSEITLYLGDSNVEQYFSRVDELIKNDPEKNNSIMFKTGGGCFPIPKVSHDKEHSHCENLTSEALELAISNPNIKNVVIAAQWNGYFNGLYGKNNAGYDDALNNLSSYIKFLVANHKKVFLVLNIPIGNELDPKQLISRDITKFPNIFSHNDKGVKKVVLEKTFGTIQTDIRTTAINSGATVINPMNYLCDYVCYALDRKGNPIYNNFNHLRPLYVRYNASFIDVTLK